MGRATGFRLSKSGVIISITLDLKSQSVAF